MEIRRLYHLLGLAAVLICAGPVRGQSGAVTERQLQQLYADCTLEWAGKQLGVRELTGRNDGPQIAAWQRLGGGELYTAWCGWYQGANQKACGLPVPAGYGGSYNWFKDRGRTYYVRGQRGVLDSIRPGHHVGWYYSNLGRIGHIGRIVRVVRTPGAGNRPRGYYVNAGNTGTGGGRDGGGVRVVYYPAYSVFSASNWLYKIYNN